MISILFFISVKSEDKNEAENNMFFHIINYIHKIVIKSIQIGILS
jgi:hypothetical protein